ncbi:ester cyclase [Bradyrhizobium sp. RDI18]|uniref:ester cyclase n=1 Tax=Bradyrhizobium sp. RDI18 TaxID=3367400 RepID=UPI00371B483F
MANIIEIAKATVTAYNNKNWNEMSDLLAADAVYDEKATSRRQEGSGQIIEALQGWAQAFPDSKGTFIREFVSNDTAILELVWKGVHTGPLQTPTGAIPASNKPIEVPACEVFRVEGGKVRSASHYFDMLTLLSQIGVTGAATPSKSAA